MYNYVISVCVQDCTHAVREIFVEGETNLGLACEEILDMVSE